MSQVECPLFYPRPAHYLTSTDTCICIRLLQPLICPVLLYPCVRKPESHCPSRIHTQIICVRSSALPVCGSVGLLPCIHQHQQFSFAGGSMEPSTLKTRRDSHDEMRVPNVTELAVDPCEIDASLLSPCLVGL